jgi:type IV pilus assembly protein PilA
MTEKIKQRLASESGFTLIELLVVLIIIAILLAIAVPAYLGFKDRANLRAAESNVRQAVPAMEGYYSDHDTYASATVTALFSYDKNLDIDHVFVDTAGTNGASYCIDKTVGGQNAYYIGPVNQNTPGTQTAEGTCNSVGFPGA